MRSKYIRFFVSSTFKDMELERNLLQEVFDELVPFYKEKGWQVETVDLRWGISEEAGLDNRTMRICKKELAQCMKISPKPNFIILLGNRYGWIPLPETICKLDFDSLEMTKQESDLFEEWYKLDKNALPDGEYVLKGRTGNYCIKEVWETNVVKQLGEMFSRNVNRLHNELLYGLSATEQEIRQGALSVNDAKEHVLAYIRDINKNTIPNEVLCDYYEEKDEIQDKVVTLQKEIRDHLSDNNIFETKEIDYSFLSTDEYKSNFKKEMKLRLMSIIENVINSFNEERRTENDIHIEYALDKAKHFVGREKELEIIKQYLFCSETKPLWIKGLSGIGKSSLLAKIVEKYRSQFDIICRFCGTTESSSDAISLVSSIWEDYKRLDKRERVHYYRIGWGKTIEEKTPEEIFIKVKHMSFNCKILLIVDAIDQVYDENYKEFKQCMWITAGGNPNVKIIFSSLEEGFDSTPHKQSFVLSDMGQDAECMLYNQLLVHNRTIYETQRAAIMQCVEQSDKSPLYIYLLSQYLLNIPSWNEDMTGLPRTTEGLVNAIITDLSQPQKYGEVLVKAALSLLATDRIGISDTEMIHLLANDTITYESIRNNSKHEIKETDNRRLPSIIWIRLSNDLKAILRKQITEVGQMNAIFHNGIKQIIVERFLKDNNSRFHYWELLSIWYANNYKQEDKHAIKELVYCLYVVTCFLSKADINGYHNMRDIIVSFLTSNWDYIAKKKHYFPVSLLEDYDIAQKLFSNMPNQQLSYFRNQIIRLKDSITEEQVLLYYCNQPKKTSIRTNLETIPNYDNAMENILSGCGNVESTLYFAKEIGDKPCMSEDGTTIASLFKDNKQVRIENLVNNNLSRTYTWKSPILEMICDESITLCAIRTANGCFIHDIINNKILVNQKLSEKGWMSLSADGLSFMCGDNGNAYIYHNHKYDGYLDKVRIAKMAPSGFYFWVLFEDGCLFRYNKGGDKGCPFPINIKDEHGDFYNPLENSGATIVACSDEKCCCHTPTVTLNISHYIHDGKDMFQLKYGNQTPVFAYSDDCQQFIDNTGRYFEIDNKGNEKQIGQLYINEQLSCINRSFTKALSAKDLRVFYISKEVGNYYVSEIYQNGFINHAQCSYDGNEIIASVGLVFDGPFIFGKKTEALRCSSRSSFSWTPNPSKPYCGIYSSSVSPNGKIVSASIKANPSQLIISKAKSNDCLNIIDLPQGQTGCTDIIFSEDSNYILAITGNYVSAGLPSSLYITNGSGKILSIKKRSLEYNNNTLIISPDNRYLLLLDLQEYAVYDILAEKDLIDDNHRLPYNSYSYFQDNLVYRTLTKNYLVVCPATRMVLSSDVKNNLLYQYNLKNNEIMKMPCDKKIIACSPTGRICYYLDKEGHLFMKCWLRSQDETFLFDKVLWVVPAIDENHIYITQEDFTIILYNIQSCQVEQKAYRGITTHQQACAQGLMTVNTSCEVSMYKAAEKYNVNIPAVTTFVRRWNLETKQQEPPSAICPMCGGKIELAEEVKQYLKEVPAKMYHEDWDNPHLFDHHCPHCKAELQFNPYIL